MTALPDPSPQAGAATRALLVLHDAASAPVAARVERLAGPAAALRTIALVPERVAVDARITEALEAIAAVSRGGTEVDVIHLMSWRQTDPAAMADLADRVETAGRRLPALRVVQLGVQIVGTEWTDDQRTLATEIERHNVRHLQGLLLLSASNRAGASLEERECLVMASDVLHALISISTLRADLIGRGPVWAVGAASVVFRRARVTEQLARHYARLTLAETVRAETDLRGRETRQGLGAEDIDSRNLDGKDHRSAMSRTTTGTVDGRIAVEPQAFADLPLELIPDALGSYADQLLGDDLDRLFARIDQNRDELTAHELDVVVRKVAADLQKGDPVELAIAYVRGAAERVLDLRDGLVRDDRPPEAPPDPAPVRAELARRIGRLPHLAAVAVRTVGFAMVGLALGLLLAPDGLDGAAPLVGAATGAVLCGGYLALRYAVNRDRIARLRRRFIDRVARHLSHRLLRHLVAAQRQHLTDLWERLTGDRPEALVARLERFAGELERADQLLEGGATPGGDAEPEQTRFSWVLPATDPESVEQLIERFPPGPGDNQRLHARVLEAVAGVGLDAPAETLAQAAQGAAAQPAALMGWADLRALLADQEFDRRKELAELLGASTAPMLDLGDHHGQPGVRHLVCTAHHDETRALLAWPDEAGRPPAGWSVHPLDDTSVMTTITAVAVPIGDHTRDGDGDGGATGAAATHHGQEGQA